MNIQLRKGDHDIVLVEFSYQYSSNITLHRAYTEDILTKEQQLEIE